MPSPMPRWSIPCPAIWNGSASSLPASQQRQRQQRQQRQQQQPLDIPLIYMDPCSGYDYNSNRTVTTDDRPDGKDDADDANDNDDNDNDKPSARTAHPTTPHDLAYAPAPEGMRPQTRFVSSSSRGPSSLRMCLRHGWLPGLRLIVKMPTTTTTTTHPHANELEMEMEDLREDLRERNGGSMLTF